MHHVEVCTTCKFDKSQFETRALAKVHEYLRCEQPGGSNPFALRTPFSLLAVAMVFALGVRSVGIYPCSPHETPRQARTSVAAKTQYS